jgi:hypothetical protein
MPLQGKALRRVKLNKLYTFVTRIHFSKNIHQIGTAAWRLVGNGAFQQLDPKMG